MSENINRRIDDAADAAKHAYDKYREVMAGIDPASQKLMANEIWKTITDAAKRGRDELTPMRLDPVRTTEEIIARFKLATAAYQDFLAALSPADRREFCQDVWRVIIESVRHGKDAFDQ